MVQSPLFPMWNHDSGLTFLYLNISLHLTMYFFLSQAWEETFQRVTNEQEIYEGKPMHLSAVPRNLDGPQSSKAHTSFRISAQLHNLLQLKQENSYLMTIAQHIGPYILSIAKVKERLDPRQLTFPSLALKSQQEINLILDSYYRFQEPKEPEDDCTEIMLKIYEDNTVTHESQHR